MGRNILTLDPTECSRTPVMHVMEEAVRTVPACYVSPSKGARGGPAFRAVTRVCPGLQQVARGLDDPRRLRWWGRR